MVVVDGSSDADFDVYETTATLKRLKETSVEFLADRGLAFSQPGIEAEADLCLPLTIEFDLFWRLIQVLVENKVSAGTVY